MDSGSSDFVDIYKICRNPWAQVDPFLIQLFTSNFPKQSRAFLNFNFASDHSKILISKQLIKKDKKRSNSIISQQQIDLMVPLKRQKYLWMKLSTDQIKLHYHHGKELSLWEYTIEPYLSFSSTRKFSNSSFKLGAVNQFNHGSIDLRYRFNIGQHRADSFYYTKCNYTTQTIRFSAIATVLFKNNQINLQKNDFMAAFNIFKNNWVGIMLENQQFRKYRINYSRFGSYFDSLKAIYLFNHQNLRLGLLYEYSVQDSITKKIQAAVQYKSQQHKANFKLKLNTLWKMGIAFEARRGNYKVQLGTTWLNIINQSLNPSQYSIGLSYN